MVGGVGTLGVAAGGCAERPAVARALFEVLPQSLAPSECGRRTVPTILEANGGGVALFDADDDDDPDLLLVIPGPYPEAGKPGGGTNRLYRNDGGRFVDVTAGSGVDLDGFCNGVAVADVDADGRRDLYITRLGTNVLLRNLGALRFEPVPDAGGAACSGWSTSALFVDLDRDGDLDLYVTRYLEFDPGNPPTHGVTGDVCAWMGLPVFCGPIGLPPAADVVYRNDGGHFTEATAALGFAAPASFGLGVIDGDWNGDGWPDVYVSNDSMPNFLFLSNGDGTVREAGPLAGAALGSRGNTQASMGIAAGDADGDGDEELLVTNFSFDSSAFYVGDGNGRFRDRAEPAGLGAPSRTMLGWGAAFLDADLDGDLDVVTANGHVYPQADAPETGTHFALPAQLYLNDGCARFRLARWPGEEPAVNRALATGDIDGDGVTDMVITRLFGEPAVWRGTAGAGRSIQVTVRGPRGNPDGCGTLLRLRDAQGERVCRVRSSGGWQSACEPRPVFAFRSPAELLSVLPDGQQAQLAVAAPSRVVVEARQP